MILIGVGGWFFLNSNQKTFIKVISPNGGETIAYGDIYMAGDLPFRWTTSESEKYKPSADFSAAIIDETGVIIREDGWYLYPDTEIPRVFAAAFSGESNIKTATKYKIRVCDTIKEHRVCDTSDDYFIVK